MFIGEKEIKLTLDEEGDKIKVEFVDESSIILNKNLFELIKKEEKGRGNEYDAIGHVMAVRFLADLSNFGLEFWQVENIGVRAETLAHNLREEKVGKIFGCNGLRDIKINDLIKEDEK